MACACKVQQQLDFLDKKYGVEGPKSKKTAISGRVKSLFNGLFLIILKIMVMPIMLLFIILTRGKVINIAKVFRLGGR